MPPGAGTGHGEEIRLSRYAGVRCIVFDTAAGHLYVKQARLPIENAVGYGAMAQEILEVMEVASVLGIHAVTAAAPILAAEVAGG
jgi:hypothetical protein